LLSVAGKRDAGDRLAVPAVRFLAPTVHECLRHELALEREYLHSFARAVGGVDVAVIRDLDAMYRAELRGTRILRIDFFCRNARQSKINLFFFMLLLSKLPFPSHP
jgi:hypothetical protein